MNHFRFIALTATAALFVAASPTACSSDSSGSGGLGGTSPSTSTGPSTSTSCGPTCDATSSTGTSPTIECQNDVDCPGAAVCGGQVCSWADLPNKKCVPADSGDPGWCAVDSDCKCAPQGATCSVTSCTFTTPDGAGGAGGQPSGSGGAGGQASGAGGAGGQSSGSGGAAGTGGSGGAGCDGVELTVKNFDGWCHVAVNGGTPALGDQTVCVTASSTVKLEATPENSGFEVSGNMWHHTNGDSSNLGETGMVSGMKSTAFETVGLAGTADCVWVCCPFTSHTGCGPADFGIAAEAASCM